VSPGIDPCAHPLVDQRPREWQSAQPGTYRDESDESTDDVGPAPGNDPTTWL